MFATDWLLGLERAQQYLHIALCVLWVEHGCLLRHGPGDLMAAAAAAAAAAAGLLAVFTAGVGSRRTLA
jgi:hypothetical protein